MFGSVAKLAALTAAASLAFSSLTGAIGSANEINPGAAVGGNCETPNAPAATAQAVIPEAPPIAALMHLTGTTYVQVDLDPSGAVNDTAVVKSSGFPILDHAALAAARASSFRPEIRDCEPVAGSYLFLVDFPQ